MKKKPFVAKYAKNSPEVISYAAIVFSNNDMKHNWKFLKGLKGRNKIKMFHIEFIVDGASANNTAETCTSFRIYFVDYPRNIHRSIPFSSSHCLDQIKFNNRSMFFS